MYVTRPAARYRNSPDAIHESPPKAPGSGYLVLQDEEHEEQATCCFGLCKDPYLKDLPFPQNRRLVVQYQEGKTNLLDSVYFIPVIDQPLSSNRYYVIVGKGKHKGKMATCSTEDDMHKLCFCRWAKDAKPTSFDSGNVYQQVEIVPLQDCGCASGVGRFFGKSVAQDGFPVTSLGRKGWRIYASRKEKIELGEALGIDRNLRARLPDLPGVSDPRGQDSAAAAGGVVGRWYCPCIFVREEGGMSAKEQLQSSMFYRMTLERFWEEIYSCANDRGGASAVEVDVRVQSKRSLLRGATPVNEDEGKPAGDGMKWFQPADPKEGGRVGLSVAVAGRMRWEQENHGWVDEELRVNVVERFDGKPDDWKSFRCYVLVERFALRRMDGRLALTCDFRHARQIRCAWDTA